MASGSSLLVDTSGLLAALFPDQAHHHAAAQQLSGWQGRLLLSPFVLAQLDYLVAKHAGATVACELLRDVAAGAYELVQFSPADLQLVIEVLERYEDQEIGLADASLVVLSNRYQSLDLLSLDERHFRVLCGFGGQPFRLLPLDSGPALQDRR